MFQVTEPMHRLNLPECHREEYAEVGIQSSEVCFKIKLNAFLDTLILSIYILIITN